MFIVNCASALWISFFPIIINEGELGNLEAETTTFSFLEHSLFDTITKMFLFYD